MTKALNALPLELDALTLRAGGLPQGRLLCRDLSLRVEAGQRWALLGPNGAGKSTLLMALAGLVNVDAGGIRLDKRALRQWPAEQLARQRAWCPQFWLDPFPSSAWETVAAALFATHSELDAAAVQAHARHWLHEFEAAELADRDVRMLSGGERQRVALATACAQAAPLLLLDEPSAHLDWSHQVLLQKQLHDWSARGGAVIAALHDLNLAWSYASHVLLLDGAGGAMWGVREEVLQADALSAAFGVSVRVDEDADGRWFRVNLENRT